MKYLWISIFILAAPLGSNATTVDSYLLNRDGVKKLKAKSYFPAYQDFTRALEDDPVNPELHMNLALALQANEEHQKAEQAYRSVSRIIPKNSPLYFEAIFNLADSQGKQKKIAEALATYQEALAIDPNSQEVKKNIELLLQNGGKGGGDGEPKEPDDKDGKGQPQDSKDQPSQEPKKQKQQPKPFDSKNLTPQDVKKILDEIKNQEQGIRAQENDKSAKEAPRGKDW